jgi:hypothetical protein
MSLARHRFDNGPRYLSAGDDRHRRLTPSYVLEPIKQLFGGVIGLDPCTEPDNPTGAQAFYAPPVDGLAMPWDASTVFVNLQCELPRLSEGGLDAIKAWIASVLDPRLIVIDTLAMVKTPRTKNDNAYDADYNAVLALRAFASEHHVAVVLVHHLRKADSDDAFDTVSGTLGLTGAPDTFRFALWLPKKPRFPL